MDRVPFIAPLDSGLSIDISKKEISKVALIDADRYKHVVVYRMWQKLMNEGQTHSIMLLNEIIDDYLSTDIFSKFDAKAYIFCFSAPSKNVFRNSITQEKKYKGNRSQSDAYFYSNKYEDMAYVYDYISERYTTLFEDDLEADDLISMLQNQYTFVFSHDKDLKQVPGFHWNMDEFNLIEISEDDAFRNLMYQILTGDATDNIPGLSGFGAKSLEKFMLNTKDLSTEALFQSVVKQFTDKYGLYKGFDTFNEMWNLVSLRINRGEYLKSRYNLTFHKFESILKTLFNGNSNAKHNGNDKDSGIISK